MSTESDGWSPDFGDRLNKFNMAMATPPPISPKGPRPPDSWDLDAPSAQSTEKPVAESSGEAQEEPAVESTEVVRTMELTEEDKAALVRKAREERLDAIRALDTGSVQKLLKKKMTAVLKTHKLVETVETASANSLSETEIAQATAEFELRFPATEDKKLVRETFEGFEKSFERRIEVQRASFNWNVKSQWARYERACAVADLHQTVELVDEALPDFTNDELFAAALHMADKFQRIEPIEPENHPDQHAILDNLEQTLEQHQARNLLRDAQFEAAVVLCAAYKLGNQYLAAHGYVSKRNEPAVRTPVRPSEEEVQRYLAEIEQFMVEKQRGGRELLELHKARQTTAAELERQSNLVFDAEKKLLDLTMEQTLPLELKLKDDSRHPAWLKKAECLTYGILQQISNVLTWLANHEPAGQDEADIVTVSKSEQRDMETARAQARLLGFALGRHYEAKMNKRATDSVVIREVEMDGLAEGAMTWADCLDWRTRKHKEQFDTARLLLSKQTKLELLQETVEAAIEEVNDTSANLQRTIRAAMAVGYDRPCNDLRALYNACAWYCKDGESATTSKSKLLYPIFPLKKEKEE